MRREDIGNPLAQAKERRIASCKSAIERCMPLCDDSRRTACVGICTMERALARAEKMQRDFPVDVKKIPSGSQYDAAKLWRHITYDKLHAIYEAKKNGASVPFYVEYPDIVYDQLHHVKICEDLISSIAWTGVKESSGIENIAAKVAKIKNVLKDVLKKDGLVFGPMLIGKPAYLKMLIPDEEARLLAQFCMIHAGTGSERFWSEAKKEVVRVREQTVKVMTETNSEPQVVRAVSESMFFVQKLMERLGGAVGQN